MEGSHQQITHQNHTEQAAGNSGQGISAAFRKLLRRVSTQMSGLAEKKTVTKSSFSFFHNEQLLKKRKASLSLFQKRKATHVASNFELCDNRHNQTAIIKLERKNEAELSRKFNESPFRSVRCHTNPASINSCKASIPINQSNEFLRAKTYQFDNGYMIKSAKNASKFSFFSRTPQNHQNNEKDYESKIKNGNRRKFFNNIGKSRQSINKYKANLSQKQGSWEPWQQYDKFEQICFINH